MKSFSRVVVAASAVILVAGVANRVHADDEYVPGQLTVVFSSEDTPMIYTGEPGFPTAQATLDSLFDSYGLVDARPLFFPGSPTQNLYLLSFGGESDLDAISAAVESLPYVVAVGKNWRMETNLPPHDYAFNNDFNGSGQLDQWTSYTTQVNRAWKVTRGSSSTVVALIDQDFDWQHPDLVGRAWINPEEDINHNGVFDNLSINLGGDLDTVDEDGDGLLNDVIGWDFIFNDPDPAPDSLFPSSHGTEMGSIICANTDNEGSGQFGLGVAGINWDSKIMALRVPGSDGTAFIEEAINYAAAKGAQIANMSLSEPVDDAVFHLVVQNAASQGMILVAAAGDHNNEVPRYPAWYPECIGVAAVDSLGYKTLTPGVSGGYLGSSYGTGIDIAAPSSQVSYNEPGIVVCRYVSGGTNYYPGDSSPHMFAFTQIATSGATAQVSGALALLRSTYPNATAQFIKSELFRGAKPSIDPVYGSKLGAGMVNAYRSLTQWGSIASNTTWGSVSQPTTIYVSGDVTVDPGVTLTILPGTTVHVARQDNEHLGTDNQRIEFNVKGTLVADGSAAQPIVFDLWDGTLNQDWVGFYFDAQSSGGLYDYCTISGAETAIESYAALTVKNSTISNCEDAGIVSIAGGALVHNCIISSPGHIGIDLQSDAAVVRSTIVDGAEDYAVRVFANTVTELKLRNSEFNNSGTGLFVDGYATVGIDSTCFFYHNGTGIHLYDAGADLHIRDCGFALNTTNGIVCDGATSPLIEYNVFAHNSGAIYSSNYASPRIQWNEIQSNGNAITASSHAAPDLGHNSPSGSQSSGNNKIAHAVKYVVNNTTDQVYSENNCWDVNTGGCSPPSSKFTGSVDRAYPQCCSFPLFTHGEGEPVPEDGFVFQSEPASPKAETRRTTALVGIVPNPFNPSTTIRYSLGSQSKVEIGVYDVAGRLIRTLVNETETAGEHSIDWRGADGRGALVASGIYFVRMTSQGQVFTQKMVLLK